MASETSRTPHSPSARSHVFFLGGNDLEMSMIRRLLEAEGIPFEDDGPPWGRAKASIYRDRIAATLAAGEATPVLVELVNDSEFQPPGIIEIDHHGDRAGADAPTSLEQVFSLLELPESAWSREMKLIAANDRGHISGLIDAGANDDEVCAIRRREREILGITEEDELAADRAIDDRREYGDGALTVVEIPGSRTSAVTDRFHPALGGPGYRNLLVRSTRGKELNFFGEGHWVERLDAAFPGGWKGGELPERGYWGKDVGDSRGESGRVEGFLRAGREGGCDRKSPKTD